MSKGRLEDHSRPEVERNHPGRLRAQRRVRSVCLRRLKARGKPVVLDKDGRVTIEATLSDELGGPMTVNGSR